MFSCQPTSVMPLKVVLKNFLNHFETLEARKKLGDDLFEAEFQSLKELTERLKLDPEYACTEGQKEVNRKKNRYKDILPYDLSRVILSEYPGVPGSDYINANLIKGASGSRAYIASQGPLPTTVMDFWRMIWECEVQVIIMACNEKESGKYKCERYWPNEGDKKQYGNITVELVKWKQVCPDFLLRTLRARCGQEERTLCQFHYWSWPDHGVPTSVGPIVDLVRLVRDCQASEALPVLVHCSAGCGRTGTICAIDYVWGLMRVGKLTDSFSLYQIIREMRMQRIAMVQTKEQYVLVHRVVAALFEQQLRIIDSHTYENLDEDGEPLLGTGSGGDVQSKDKIYENLDDLGLEDRSREKENTENDEKCDKEKEVTAGSEESLSKAPLHQDATADLAGNEDTSQRQIRASRSMSWSPEPNSVATSSSALSSSDPRGGSRSSVITDDEDSQSCKDDSVQVKKCLGKKKNGDEQGSTLSRGRSLSATNICLEDSAGKAGKGGETPGKIVGKATVIRRPSIARLKALFEKSDSDDVNAGEANRRRPVFRSYSQRITPRRPSVAQVPDGMEAPSMASKFKPLLSKRKSLGPSARKAKEFRDQEKSQKQLGASSATTSKTESQAEQPVPETLPTTKVMTTPPVLMVSSSSEANTRPQGAASSLSGIGSDTWEKNVLYKSFSSSNLSGLASQATGNVSSSKPLSEASRISLSSSVSSKLGHKCDPPPQLPTKKRTVQTLYAPIPFYTVDPTARKSQTLPALAGNADSTQSQHSQARGSSIYDFLPWKDADMPPRLPPKTKLSKLHTPVVPISALNNTYVNVSDMLLARNELMSRLSDGRYMNVNPEAKENLKRIESVIRQHPRGAIIDLTSRKSFNDRIAAVSKYEQVWDGKTFVKRDTKAETEPGKTGTTGQPAKNEGDSWYTARRDCYESGTAVDNSTAKEKSATLPSAFRTHDRTNQRDFPPHSAKQDPSAVSSSDMDTSDIYTTHDERSGTEYDTLFAESSDATETDAPGEKDEKWKGMVGVHPGHAHAMPPQLTKGMPGRAVIADMEVKRPLPAYETIYPLQPGFIGRRVPYTSSNPPPKPPRTYGYSTGGKHETGHVGAPVGYPKKAQLSESIYQVPPQPRTTPHMISRPLHRLPSSCDPSAFLPSGVPNFGAAPFVPLYHPRQGVSAIRSPDYENVYACRSAVGDGQSTVRQQGTRIVKHHSEYRPQVKASPREPDSSRPGNTVPTAKAPLQHSFSDASIYEALRGSLSQQPQQHQQEHQQEQQRLADIQAQYAVVVKPKKSGLQKSKTVVSESALLGPSAPPRCRRQLQQDSADSSDGAGCKIEKQGGAGDVAQVHAKPSKKGTASGSKGNSKEGSSSGSEGSGFISGTLSKAFGRLNPFYKANSGAAEEAKKKSTSQSTTTSPKKPEVPKKPGNIAMLRTSKKQPAPQPKTSKAPDFTGQPLSQGPNDSGSEHWTQV